MLTRRSFIIAMAAITPLVISTPGITAATENAPQPSFKIIDGTTYHTYGDLESVLNKDLSNIQIKKGTVLIFERHTESDGTVVNNCYGQVIAKNNANQCIYKNVELEYFDDKQEFSTSVIAEREQKKIKSELYHLHGK